MVARFTLFAKPGELFRSYPLFGVPEKTLERWYYIFLERREQAASPEAASPIRIDELSLKEGPRILDQLHDLKDSLPAIFEDHRVQRLTTASLRRRVWIEAVRRTGIAALSSFCSMLEN